jgi:hypothetical protein
MAVAKLAVQKIYNEHAEWSYYDQEFDDEEFDAKWHETEVGKKASAAALRMGFTLDEVENFMAEEALNNLMEKEIR